MSRNPILRCALTAMILGLFVAPVFSDEGRIPIWRPTVIGADGKYVVTRNITVPAGGGAAITVAAAADHVDIDLNGFTLTGDPAGLAPVIEAVGPRSSVTIRNGDIRGVTDAIAISTPGAGVVEKVVVEDVRIQSTAGGILLVDVLNFSLRRNVISRVGGDGIAIFGAPVPMTGTIEGNVIREPAGIGIRVDGTHSALAVRNNRVEASGFIGINITGGEGFLVAYNTVEGSGADGLLCEASNNSKIYNNVLTRNGSVGMRLRALGGFLVLDNVSSFNTEEGLLIEGAFINHVDRNVLNFNGSCGIRLSPGSTDNTFGRNTVRLNDTGGLCGGFACLPPGAPNIVGPCTPPTGGAVFPPEFCNENAAEPAGAYGNSTFCDNMMPGPPRS